VPTLLIWGANDLLFPKDYAFAYQKLIPHAKTVIIPDCGHIPNVERPAEFVAELTSFIDGMRIAA
jgi:pimeloyl-ACP methyl ester carboxylesterase